MSGKPVDQQGLATQVRSAVIDVLRKQVEAGIDSVNDGEMSKTSFSDYVTERLGGIQKTAESYYSPITGRDTRDFPDYFSSHRLGGGFRKIHRCTRALTYVGQTAVQTDIDNLKAALAGRQVEQAYLPAVAPGSIEHWLKNEYYSSHEDFLRAIGQAMHEEYKAIVDAGFVLQIDDPDLADGWQAHTGHDLAAYRKEAQLRTDVLSEAIRGLPADRIIMHMCWGSGKGPHVNDLPLREFVDIVLSLDVGGYSIEAANPRHDWEWQVWETAKLPAGKILIPGVLSHTTDHVEHPELVAQRLIRYAQVVGAENVIAGTDCGLGSRVANAEVCWAKLRASVEGARLASQRLFR
ncbi:MAG: cobalamin-independent methionine synthase II family protein, partial [Chloroflexota bacterium]